MSNEEQTKEDAKSYHRVMHLLRNLNMPHGKCEPRSHRACTHCNSKEAIDAMVKAYKGAPMVAH